MDNALIVCTYNLSKMELVSFPSNNHPPDDGGTSLLDECKISNRTDSNHSDSYSEEGCSSDSGKGGSDQVSDTLTPSESLIENNEVMIAPLLSSAYSPYSSYSKSLGAIMPGHAMIYEFEIPQTIVGRLIGKYGSFVNKIKQNTGACIIVKRHYYSESLKICALEGLCTEIEEAIKLIRERFPLKKFPCLSLEQVNPNDEGVAPRSNISLLPSNNKLSLIEGILNDVTVSCIVNLNHIFVQQPTHPTYPALARLHQSLKSLYEQPGAPNLLRPFNVGVICVTRVEDDWYRAEVVEVNEEKDEVTARLVDIGGYVHATIDSLRQIRIDFVTIPFQATECRLANVGPQDGSDEWSQEALDYFRFQSLSIGQVLQAFVIGYSPTDNMPLIQLYRLNKDQSMNSINEELIELGFAKWVDAPILPLCADFSTDEDVIYK